MQRSTAVRPSIIRYMSSKTTDTTDNSPLVEMVDYDDSRALPIPTYIIKDDEPLELRKSRLVYQSRKRGMLENGLLLSTFASKYLHKFDAKQTELYDRLINEPTNDWEIFYWATGSKPTPSEYDNEIMKLLKSHVSNPDKEERFCQPAL